MLRSCSIAALTGVSVRILLFANLGRRVVAFLAVAFGYGLAISGDTAVESEKTANI